jgi:hypothetical protein
MNNYHIYDTVPDILKPFITSHTVQNVNEEDAQELETETIKMEMIPLEEPQFPQSFPLKNSSFPDVVPLKMSDPDKTTVKHTEVNDFNKIIIEYIQKNKPSLYILTPCYGGTCFVNYVLCLMATIEFFNKIGFPLCIEFCKNDSLVSRARNNLVAKAMSNPATTHILFIDADISWDPLDIIKLVLSDKPLVGGIYPLKRYDWNKVLKDPQNPFNTNVVQSILNRKNSSQFASLISDETAIQSNLLKYNVNYLDTTLCIENNLAKVRHIATGFMMFKRNVIENMSMAYPQTKYVDDVGFLSGKENDFAYALFDCGVEEGHYFSEDWMFCHRWSKLGGSIFIEVSINLTHTGVEDYKGSYIASII